MFQRIRNRAQEQKGFTLIELLVVILIIGILAAIAIPTFLNQRGKAQDARAKSQVKTAQIAEETYFTDNNGATTAHGRRGTSRRSSRRWLPGSGSDARRARRYAVDGGYSATGRTVDVTSSVATRRDRVTRRYT